MSTQLSEVQKYDYDPPELLEVVPANGPTSGGTEVVLIGKSFGTQGSVEIGGEPCVRVSHNNTHFVCTTPAGQGVGKDVIISVNGAYLL